MSFETTLLDGLGHYLAGAGPLEWSPAADYAPGALGLYVDALPVSPDRAVAMALYPVDDNTGTTDSTVGVQFRLRGRPRDRRDVKDLADAIFEALHDATGYTLGGIPVVRSWRQSAASLGEDGNHRQESTHNYYLQVTRTAPHRRD